MALRAPPSVSVAFAAQGLREGQVTQATQRVGATKQRAAVRHGAMVRRYIVPVLGDLPFEELNRRTGRLPYKRFIQTMQEGGGKLKRPVSAHGQRSACNTLQTALNDSVENGILDINHTARMRKPRVNAEEPACWTAAQAAAFLAHPAVTGHRLRALWRLGLDAGMRQGELLAMRWDAIDWKAATVTARKSLEQLDGSRREKEPKTRRVRRIIVAAETLAALRDHQERMQAEGWDTASGPVFVSETGTWIIKQNLNRT